MCLSRLRMYCLWLSLGEICLANTILAISLEDNGRDDSINVIFKSFPLIFGKSDGEFRILSTAISYDMEVHYQGVKSIIHHKIRRGTPLEKHLTCTGVMLYSCEILSNLYEHKHRCFTFALRCISLHHGFHSSSLLQWLVFNQETSMQNWSNV